MNGYFLDRNSKKSNDSHLASKIEKGAKFKKGAVFASGVRGHDDVSINQSVHHITSCIVSAYMRRSSFDWNRKRQTWLIC